MYAGATKPDIAVKTIAAFVSSLLFLKRIYVSAIVPASHMQRKDAIAKWKPNSGRNANSLKITASMLYPQPSSAISMCAKRSDSYFPVTGNSVWL